MEVLFENAHRKYVREDTARRSLVKCVYPGTASVLMRYRFNNIPDRFSSPYVSWANMSCVDSICNKEYLRSAVQEGKKLYAGDAIAVKRTPDDRYPTVDEAIAEVEAFAAEQPDDVLVGLESPCIPGWLNFYICRKGKISDYFDIDEVFSFYRKLGFKFSDQVKEEVTRLCNYELRDYSNQDTAPFDYANPDWCNPLEYSREKAVAQLITNGLLLGYPLESTAYFIERDYGKRW